MATRKRKSEKESKSFKIKTNEVVDVVFEKDNCRFKKGDSTQVSLPIAYKFWAEGKIKRTDKVKVSLEDAGLLEMSEERRKQLEAEKAKKSEVEPKKEDEPIKEEPKK